MSSGLSSEGHSSSRAPKAPRSRARLRAQQVAENAQVEAKKSKPVQAESAQSQSAQSQTVKVSVTKVEAPHAEAQPTGATQTNAVKPAVSATSE
ncbi:MAG: hypothetical protein DI608_05965, partial [Rothia mucilaginosa]